ncbi:MAG: S9 family peptidase [Verrucomicrobiae bacterium]|nr:S9 family peptidase [Verrucomicrobiae bacterium]
MAADDDPFLWLEDIDGEKALAWVRERNAETKAILESEPGFESLNQRLLSIFQSDAKIPYVTARGEWLYNFWQDETYVRGLWRRTTLDSYRTTTPEWETVLDLDALAKKENENWVWKGPTVYEPDYDRALLRLSRGGGDAVVIREFDLEKSTFVEGGFEVPEAKSNASWLDRDTLLVGTDFGEGSLTESGYPRTTRLWKRGTPLESAELVFEGKVSDVSASAYAFWHRGKRRRMAYRGIDFYNTEEFLWHDDDWVRLEKPDDVEVSLAGEHLLFHPRKDWETEARTWAADSLLAMETDRFLAGDRNFDLLYEPKPRSAYKGFEVTASAIIINELAEVKDRFTVARFSKETGWQRQPLDAPGSGSVGISAFDSENSDRYWAIVTDFLTPTTLYLAELGQPEAEKLKSLPDFFDSTGLLIEQNQATSADGTRIPYFLVRPKDLPLDGTHPTLLYGYGGFEVSMESSYSASVGAAWLERGGVYALANIRGGGEFGPAWHQAALKENRQRAYDDFIAVGEDLIARGFTSSDHLGVAGGSNGGLLTGNMLVQRPDLFGAVVSMVPLLDMRRFNQLLAGASWMAEYGDPDDPEQWAWLKNYSPYHQVKADVDYPPVLFATSTRDDRVHPGHARKMVARMLEQGHQDVFYYENIEGGHGGAANLKQSAYLYAIEYTFLWRFLEKADS